MDGVGCGEVFVTTGIRNRAETSSKKLPDGKMVPARLLRTCIRFFPGELEEKYVHSSLP